MNNNNQFKNKTAINNKSILNQIKLYVALKSTDSNAPVGFIKNVSGGFSGRRWQIFSNSKI